MIQRIGFGLLVFSAALGYALESDNRAEQARNVSKLEVVKVRLVSEKLASDIFSGKVTRTFTPTQVVNGDGTPTPTVTGTVTPTATPTAGAIGKATATPSLVK